jgi:hypothetical protein
MKLRAYRSSPPVHIVRGASQKAKKPAHKSRQSVNPEVKNV